MESTGKANPFRWVWNQARKLYRRLRGEHIDQIVEPDDTLRDRYVYQELGDHIADRLTDRLFSGRISIQEWQSTFRRELKEVYMNLYRAARGGTGAMTKADWGSLGGMLKEQYHWMNRFAQQIANGEVGPDAARARTGMYFKSGREAFERAQRRAYGIPVDLPQYPGDGKTVCLTNCQCGWVIKETKTHWLCTWTLGPAEHCPDCLDNAAKWSPLPIEKPRRFDGSVS